MSSRIRQLAADPAVGYVLRALAWFLALLGALRLPWIQSGVLIPFARLQGQAVELVRGQELRVLIDTSCTGSDAIAVCLGAILAFPVAWKKRLLAAGGGFALITLVNTVRIGHLSGLVDRREALDLFHYRIWPALVILVAAGYAFAWMRRVSAPAAGSPRPEPRSQAPRPRAAPFAALAVALVALYYLAYESLLASRLLFAAARAAAATAGGLMTLMGLEARVSGGVLTTPGGGWIVSPECVTTPLIPLVVAAILTLRLSWPTRLALLAATPAVFFVLGAGRLMVLAVPASLIGSPGIAVHAFYQILLAVGLVAWASTWRGAGKLRGAATALAIGLLGALAGGALYSTVLRPALMRSRVHLGHGWIDDQGAVLLLPALALGLSLALWSAAGRRGGWRGLARGAGLAGVAAGLSVVVAGEVATHTSILPPVVVIRLAALGLPILAAWALAWIRPRPKTPASTLRQAPSPAA